MKEFGNEFVSEDESDIRKPKSPTGLVDDISETESPLSPVSETSSAGDWVSSPELLVRGTSKCWDEDPKVQAESLRMLLKVEDSDHEIESPVKEEEIVYDEILSDWDDDGLVEDLVGQPESPVKKDFKMKELPELITEDPTPGQSKKLVNPVRGSGSRKSPNLQLKKRCDHKKESKVCYHEKPVNIYFDMKLLPMMTRKKYFEMMTKHPFPGQSKKLTGLVSPSPKSPNLQLKKTGLRRSVRLEKKKSRLGSMRDRESCEEGLTLAFP
ncbi:hypothetical protein OROMI_005185 [Orobanche minor]